MACGELGFTIAYFYSLTPRQFDNILEGYRRKEEAKIKLKYELNRDLEWAIISPYLDDKNPKHPATILEYRQFPWETPLQTIEMKQPKKPEEHQAFWDALDAKKAKTKNTK